MTDTEYRLPSTSQRAALVGRTGSGKTQHGFWLLSKAAFDKQPFFIVDFKRDELLNSTDRIKEIGLHEKLPKEPGIYITHPHPAQDAEVEAWLWKIWERGKSGLYVDEGYMLPDKGAMRAILTQGRSLKIPCIILSQRPVWLSRFVFSEADFFTVFHLNDTDDKKTVGRFLPTGLIKPRLADYHSAWYDVARDKALYIKPVPSADEITQSIEDRLKPGKRRFV